MIEVVLFDVGGVLMGDAIDDKLADLAERYDLALPRLLVHKAELRPKADLGELSDAGFWTQVLEREGISAEPADLDLRAYLELIPGVLELVGELRSAGYRLAILSNDSAELTRVRRDAFGLDALFDPVLISSDLGVIKPDPAIYRLALDRLGVAADRVVFVDNLIENVEAARACGMHGLVFTGVSELRQGLARLGISSPAGAAPPG